MNLKKLDYLLWVCQLKKQHLPHCAHSIMEILLINKENRFFSFIESEGEITLIMDQETLQRFPKDYLTTSPKKYYALEITGPLGASAVGIIHSIAEPLSEAGISIFYLSSYQTDYALIAEDEFQKSLSTLSKHFTLLNTAIQIKQTSSGVSESSEYQENKNNAKKENRRKLGFHQKSLCLASLDKEEPFLLASYLLQLIFFVDKREDRFFSYHETNGIISLILSKSELSTLLFLQGDENFIRVYDNEFTRISIIDQLGIEECGIVDSIAAPLTRNNISLFYLSSFNSAHVLVSNSSFISAQTALNEKYDIIIK
uniref:CASTOR ACT domain-containing protein n=1 Tax=Arcella intermedia TaxID=1963864 RepID=A0A6B2LAI1_9EUKA